MKRAWVVLVLLMVAGVARADENARMQQGEIPVARTAIGTQTGSTWTGTTAERPLPIDGNGSYCATGYNPSGMTWNANGSETDAALTIATICPTGRCRRILIRNWDTTNSVMIQFNSSSGTQGVCLGPASAAGQPSSLDSSLWIPPASGVTAVYRTTTSTTSCPTGVTVAAAHMDAVGCP